MTLAFCFVGLQISYLTWGIIQVRRAGLTPWCLTASSVYYLPRAGADDEATIPGGAARGDDAGALFSISRIPGDPWPRMCSPTLGRSLLLVCVARCAQVA